MPRPTHGELFAGTSGFGMGFERAGIETAWRVENDPHCQRLLKGHYPDTLLLGDVQDCGAHNLPPVDIISFGSPCQDLSVAGKRKGLEGERSGLFFEGIRIIRELRPTLAIWENVGGAQSSHSGRDFASAIQALAESGALAIGWAVLDARWFGVPQRRRRVFIVADFGGGRAGQILAIPSGLRGDTPPSREAGERIADSLTVGANQYSGFVGEPVEVAGTLGGGAGSRGWASDPDRMAFVPAVSHALNGKQGNRDDGESETFIPYSIRTAQTGANGWGVQEHQAHTLDGAQQAVAFSVNQRREGRMRDVHASLNGEQSGTQVDGVIDGFAVRRLTPTECERLQAFPDGYTAGFADSVRYRMLGNAVCVNVAAWLGQQIMEALRTSRTSRTTPRTRGVRPTLGGYSTADMIGRHTATTACLRASLACAAGSAGAE